MEQSSVIAWFLLAGFIVFVTVRGELPQYLAVLGLESGATANPAGGLPVPPSGTYPKGTTPKDVLPGLGLW